MQKQSDRYFKKPSEWGHVVESSVGTNLVNHSISQNYWGYYWLEKMMRWILFWKDEGKLLLLKLKVMIRRIVKGLKYLKINLIQTNCT